MKPSVKDLYAGLDEHPRLRKKDRKQLLILHEQRTRPIWMQWIMDGGAMVFLYLCGYAGAYAYWWTLDYVWDDATTQWLAPLGHTVPALVVGAYTGQLIYRGRYFFIVGPLVLFAATLYRELIRPWGLADTLGTPLWLIWASCLEGMVTGGIAMAIGAWAGHKSG